MTVVYLIILVVVALVLERVSMKDPFRGIEHDLQTSKAVLECEEPFEITTTVTNAKPRPVLFLYLEENIPTGLVLLGEKNPEKEVKLDNFNEKRAILTQTLYLMPKEKARRAVKACLNERGRYIFHNGRLKIGDLLGFDESTLELSFFKEVVVLPRRVETPDFKAAFGNYLGDISVRRFILSDPILTAGFREYSGREPMRDISWPASLRQGKLMVKQFDYTAELTTTVILNITGGSAKEIELCYSLARCVCEDLETRRVSYSFITNAYAANATGHWTFMGDGLGDNHLNAILEGLGRATHEWLYGLDRLLNKIINITDSGKAFVLITPPLTGEDRMVISRFESRCASKVFVIEADTEAYGVETGEEDAA